MMSCKFILSLDSLDAFLTWAKFEKFVYRVELINDLDFAVINLYDICPDLYRKIYDWINYRNRKEL